MLSEDILYSPVASLALKIRTQKISPVELTESYLTRLEAIGPKLGALVTLMREQALEQARAAEKEIKSGRYRGPLHGIPFGVKDLLATKGIPTTWGAAPYKSQVFDYDATVVEKLRNAGAILIAKLAMVELAGGMGYNNPDASFTGPGRTPWNTNFWSGGSSSGPGAATAAGLVAFSIGSETSGSILTPSACCGLSGLRPTYGLVSRHGAMALCWSLDKLGPMCRTADDCGLVLAAIAGKDPQDPTSVSRKFDYPLNPAAGTDGTGRAGVTVSTATSKRRFKIGVIKDSTKDIQPEVKANFEQTIQVLQQYCDVTPDVVFPDFPWGNVVGTIVNAEGASAFFDLIESGKLAELQTPRDRIGGYTASVVSAVDYLQAMRIRGPMQRAYQEFMTQFDAVIAPTRSAVAPPIGVDFDKAYPEVKGGTPLIPAGNAVGAPALCVPNGFGQNGLPTSIQFLGAPFSEKILVEIGNAFQARTPWHEKHPSIS
ncbi:MAG: amidase [Acidobacteriia bacterium]|nr:amidase [Terriglobia bacterium]